LWLSIWSSGVAFSRIMVVNSLRGLSELGIIGHLHHPCMFVSLRGSYRRRRKTFCGGASWEEVKQWRICSYSSLPLHYYSTCRRLIASDLSSSEYLLDTEDACDASSSEPLHQRQRGYMMPACCRSSYLPMHPC
jgi:hypothetical protein